MVGAAEGGQRGILLKDRLDPATPKGLQKDIDHLLGRRRFFLQPVPKRPQPKMGETIGQMAVIDPVAQFADAFTQPHQVLTHPFGRLVEEPPAVESRPRHLKTNLQIVQGLLVQFLSMLELAGIGQHCAAAARAMMVGGGAGRVGAAAASS